jgi:hypothetical protein
MKEKTTKVLEIPSLLSKDNPSPDAKISNNSQFTISDSPKNRVKRSCEYCKKRHLKCSHHFPCDNCKKYERECIPSIPKKRYLLFVNQEEEIK